MNTKNKTAFITMLSFIRAHYTEPIGLADIANSAGITTGSVYEIFHCYVGMPPIRYLNRLRIDISKEILIETDKPIKDIARECGFLNGNYFGNVFKQVAGITPSEFRKNGLAANR